ncbi:hypothetical protein P3X46_023968 [Hevea brasiliensis]|uniref:Uncharacterized protein n=1 Tax=Hevea brasiliensis TaxID=3981 RepID=A0ABQ9LCQ5_HEVBR|nr:UPF0481 protein At3g47200-like isoform X1 [Hevea brasiliensis]KAJ9164388.1 hypothetical protein P3X46_023968 [Hevea brasiliensis]
MEIEETSSTKQMSDQVSLDIEKLERCMRREMESLHHLSDQCCIYRVPVQLRELNEKAYTPRVVSIGPLHYGKEEFRAMEEHKKRYLFDFLNRSGVSLLEFIKATETCETELRNCYAENIQFPREDFVKMMLTDAAFLIEYFLKRYFGGWPKADRVFRKQRLTNNIRYDILLLENQVPFFFLEKLLNLSKVGISIVELIQCFFTREVIRLSLKLKNLSEKSFQALHLVDFLRICLQPSNPTPNKKYRNLSTPTITHLHQAGVKFESSSSNCLLDIKFEKGILYIPEWKITDHTETLLRNILAFEQCHSSDNYTSDYVIIMDFLINDEEDVQLLIQNGIIENWLQDNQAVATFVNSLGNQTLVGEYFYFSDLVKDLNAYCKIPRNKWKATLKQKYFNNPWTIISVIAASFLLMLTVIQTVCSILQVD